MGLEGEVFFYRNSNQNEVYLLIKQEGELTAIEVKSSMTYSSSFEKTLTQIEGWIKTPISKKAIVYSGNFENTNGDINLINYRHISSILWVFIIQDKVLFLCYRNSPLLFPMPNR